MRRSILVALGIGFIVTSAAAIGITSTAMPEAAAGPRGDLTFTQMKRFESSARDAQRARIDERYEAERARCDPLRGLLHDRCLISAHAHRGHALLEAAAPYQVRQ
ncbi:MAG TPA: hypothetical protein VH040_17605 [Usitatibacter sp.]|jgi:hypothetical protein|nr:hypothetical protein [Usitatibacter sp.]